MKSFTDDIKVPKLGWLVTVNWLWWQNWKDVINVDPDGSFPFITDRRYRLAWSNYCGEDRKFEPFLVVRSEINHSYVRHLGFVPNVEVHFLAGENLRHIFAEAKNPELLSGIFLRMHKDDFR